MIGPVVWGSYVSFCSVVRVVVALGLSFEIGFVESSPLFASGARSLHCSSFHRKSKGIAFQCPIERPNVSTNLFTGIRPGTDNHPHREGRDTPHLDS